MQEASVVQAQYLFSDTLYYYQLQENTTGGNFT